VKHDMRTDLWWGNSLETTVWKTEMGGNVKTISYIRIYFNVISSESFQFH